MPAELTDVVIVGAGACGSLMANDLAARGFTVTVLEAGKRFDATNSLQNTESNGAKILWNEPRVYTGKHGVVPKAGLPGCGGFYGTVRYAAGTPLTAESPISVGICWDGQRVTKTWGPDCAPSYGPGLVLSVETCQVTAVSDGTMIVTIQSSVRPLTSVNTGGRSDGAAWLIGPDGRFRQI